MVERAEESLLRTLPIQDGLLAELTVTYSISLLLIKGVTPGLGGVPIRQIWWDGL